jgi:hypothetical protein
VGIHWEQSQKNPPAPSPKTQKKETKPP